MLFQACNGSEIVLSPDMHGHKCARQASNLLVIEKFVVKIQMQDSCKN